MMEQWHPLGPIGIVTAFNFPVAVWAWNAALAAIAGDTMIWYENELKIINLLKKNLIKKIEKHRKPSSKTPFTAIATQIIASRVAERNGFPGVFNLIIGRGADVGEVMLSDKRLPLISATGSTRMGKRIAVVVGERLGRTLLELGGNNAIIIMNDANLDLAVRAVAFGAVGTAGQRCTSTRRLILQRDVAPKVVEALKKAYTQVRIGDPLEQGVLMGPLIDQNAVKDMMHAVAEAKKQGGTVVTGGNVHPTLGGNFVEPTIITAPASNVLPISDDETFAPILYVFVVDTLEEAIRMNNAVPQGLSSSIFTSSMYHQEHFLSPAGSDCGIANVNIGTSGAEIGGAFGGDKETGGGRESGSDSWKAYMRRVTNTINYGASLPLAQGVKFDI
jgi:aldehyde dehydrogenase (NAD+)